MTDKYEILKNDSIEHEGRRLYRIRALRDFGDYLCVKAGNLGGYIQHKSNLSQEYDSWVYFNAKVYDNAEISNNAIIFGNAEVYDNARVSCHVWVSDNAKVHGNARVSGYVRVSYGSTVSGDTRISSNVTVTYDGTEPKQNNTSKPQLELISPRFILALGRVLTNGSKKYGYAKFLDFKDKDFLLDNCTYQKHIGAAMRHIEKWKCGIDYDEESAEHHLIHAASRLMMIYAYSNNKEAAKLLDNRIYKDVE